MTITRAGLLTLLLLVLLAPAWATHGVDTDDDGIIDLPFDPMTLEPPDRDDVRNAFEYERITWNQDWLIASKCGGFERIEACEDRGGYVVVEDGLGCGSTVKLYQYAGFGKSKKVVKMASAGRLAGVNAAGELVQVPRETEQSEVLAKAVQGKLVMISSVVRDRRKLRDVGEIRVGCRCTCVVDKLVGAQVVNAEKGDVGLVPLSAPGGEDIVVTIFNAIEQRHRHAVIFLGPHRIRHNTAYDEPDEYDMLDDNEFKLGPLNNATPGVTTESVASAISNGRLAYEGLLLKPAADWIRPPSRSPRTRPWASRATTRSATTAGSTG